MITVYHHVSCVLTLWRERVNIVTSIVGLMFHRFTTREVELEDAIRGQQGLGFTHMYTRMARVTDPTQVSPVPL